MCSDFTRAERILAINNPLMQFCVYAVMVFVLSFGSYTVITSRGIDLDGTAFRPFDLQLYDPDEPDDDFHGVRNDHHGGGIGKRIVEVLTRAVLFITRKPPFMT